MKLTLAIIFCDKDKDLLINLLQNIKENVQIEHDILLWDNREIIEDIGCLKDYKVLNTGGGNIKQFKARQRLIELCTTDYIWFIDADDEILTVEKYYTDLFDKDYELISFNYTVSNFNTYRMNKRNEEVTEIPYEEYGAFIWNKWFKTSLLKEQIKKIPQSLDCVASEDIIIGLLMLTSAKKMYRTTRFIYNYQKQLSSAGIEDFSFCFDKYLHLFYGFEEARDFVKTIAPEDVMKKIEEMDLYFYLNKIKNTRDEEICKKMYERFLQAFTKEEAENCLYTKIMGSFDISKKKWEKMIRVMEPKPRYILIESVSSFDENGQPVKTYIQEEVKPFFEE